MTPQTLICVRQQPNMASVEFMNRCAGQLSYPVPDGNGEGNAFLLLYVKSQQHQQLRRYLLWHERYTAFLETYGQPVPREEGLSIVTRLSEGKSLALWKPGEQLGSLVSTSLWQEEVTKDVRQQKIMPPSLLQRWDLTPSTTQQAALSDSLCFEPQVFYFFHKPSCPIEIKILPLTMEERIMQRHLWRTYSILPYTDPEGRMYRLKKTTYAPGKTKTGQRDTLASLDAPLKLHESRRGRKHGPLDANGYPEQTAQFLRHITKESGATGPVTQWSDLRERVIMALTILATSSPSSIIPTHLHYIEGYNQKDVARQLGVQQSAVSQSVQQGISNLLDICQMYGDDDTDLMKDVLKSLKRAGCTSK